jgi:hypothetical protein
LVCFESFRIALLIAWIVVWYLPWQGRASVLSAAASKALDSAQQRRFEGGRAIHVPRFPAQRAVVAAQPRAQQQGLAPAMHTSSGGVLSQ